MHASQSVQFSVKITNKKTQETEIIINQIQIKMVSELPAMWLWSWASRQKPWYFVLFMTQILLTNFPKWLVGWRNKILVVLRDTTIWVLFFMHAYYFFTSSFFRSSWNRAGEELQKPFQDYCFFQVPWTIGKDEVVEDWVSLVSYFMLSGICVCLLFGGCFVGFRAVWNRINNVGAALGNAALQNLKNSEIHCESKQTIEHNFINRCQQAMRQQLDVMKQLVTIVERNLYTLTRNEEVYQREKLSRGSGGISIIGNKVITHLGEATKPNKMNKEVGSSCRFAREMVEVVNINDLKVQRENPKNQKFEENPSSWKRELDNLRKDFVVIVQEAVTGLTSQKSIEPEAKVTYMDFEEENSNPWTMVESRRQKYQKERKNSSTSIKDNYPSEEKYDAPQYIKEHNIYPLQAKKPSPPRRERTPQTPEEEKIAILKKELADLRQQQADERKQRGVLTPEEQQMSREQLLAKWTKDRREQRFGLVMDQTLTEEEKLMSRSALQRKFAEENHMRWVARMKSLGKTLINCDICGKFKLEGQDEMHWCVRSNLRFPGGQTAGVKKEQELVVSGGSRGMKIDKQYLVDPQKVDKALEALNKMKEKLSQQLQQATERVVEVKQENVLKNVVVDLEKDHKMDDKVIEIDMINVLTDFLKQRDFQ